MANDPDNRAQRRAAEQSRAPTVLVVLVTRNGAAWLRQCLIALSRQTHPRMSVLAVDNGSSDASPEMLETTLGSERVVRLAENRGFPAAAAAAMASPAAVRADYLLLLHDDTLLAPEAVEHLVDAAERIEDAGIVGPKVLDAGRPEVLREVGLSADRFGYPYSPLEDGELDQGQYDRVREVLAISSAAMLVRRETFERIGLPDERFLSRFGDVDFGWRARLAGYRVLMTPSAVAFHRGARDRGERAGAAGPVRVRFERESAALAGVLENYSWLTLIWMLPLWLAQSLARILYLVVSRRFEDAYQMLASIGWNIAHAPSTYRRRRRAQGARRLRDRRIRPFMAPSGLRLRRWAVAAADLLRAPDEEQGIDDRPVPAWRRAARFAAEHPLFVAWTAATLLAAAAYRHLAGASPLSGGAIASFPSSPSGFFAELASGIRDTGLGGTQAASPALGLLGLGSVAALDNPELLQKSLLFVLPAAGAVGAYRAARNVTSRRVPAVVTGACYALAPTTMWALSDGRVPELVFLAGLPWLANRLRLGFFPSARVRRARWVIGAGAGLAVLVAFYPGTLLAAAVVVLTSLLVSGGGRRSRGLADALLAAAVAALLLFPFAWELLAAGGSSLASLTEPRTFGDIARLSPGVAPGSWLPAFYLPAAAALGLALASRRLRGPATRAAVAGVLGLYLAWGSSAGWLPAGLTNAVAYLGLAAFSFTLLIGLGLTSLFEDVQTATFGYRQLAAAVMTLVVGVGLVGQAWQAGLGAWTIGDPDRVPAAYSLVADAAGPPSRVLWLASRDDGELVAPGGPAEGAVDAGPASVRFAVGGPAGATALDIGRPPAGPGYDAIRRALVAALSGATRHAGGLLAPFAVRYVVAVPGGVPSIVLRRLAEQVDLVRVPAGGLTIFRNVQAVPIASRTASDWAAAASSNSPLGAAELRAAGSRAFFGSGQRYDGGASPSGFVFLSQQFDSRWRMSVNGAAAAGPERAFGWAVGFPPQGAPVVVRFTGQWARTLETILLAMLWGIALWVTRRPAGGG